MFLIHLQNNGNQNKDSDNRMGRCIRVFAHRTESYRTTFDLLFSTRFARSNIDSIIKRHPAWSDVVRPATRQATYLRKDQRNTLFSGHNVKPLQATNYK